MPSREVIIGIDIGSWTFKICAYDGKQFEILTNEANFRETPSLVGFTVNERLVGEEAQNKVLLLIDLDEIKLPEYHTCAHEIDRHREIIRSDRVRTKELNSSL